MTNLSYEDEVLENLSITDETLDACDFDGCTFRHCSLINCFLTNTAFSDCVFEDCTVQNPKLRHCELKFGVFRDCTLIGVNWVLLKPESGFSEPIDKLQDCRLRYCTFENLNYTRFDFSTCALTGCTFSDTSLKESSFRGCDLTDTEIFRCNISKADFRQAVGYRIDIGSCVLKGARFSTPEVINLLYSLDIRID